MIEKNKTDGMPSYVESVMIFNWLTSKTTVELRLSERLLSETLIIRTRL